MEKKVLQQVKLAHRGLNKSPVSKPLLTKKVDTDLPEGNLGIGVPPMLIAAESRMDEYFQNVDLGV
jgi:hypothetical protein